MIYQKLVTSNILTFDKNVCKLWFYPKISLPITVSFQRVIVIQTKSIHSMFENVILSNSKRPHNDILGEAISLLRDEIIQSKSVHLRQPVHALLLTDQDKDLFL